jgi:Protein of unknown function (DUF3014)
MDARRKNPPIVLVALAIIGAAITAYFVLRKQPEAPPPAPVAQQAPPAPKEEPLPPVDQSDARIRQLLAGTSAKLAPFLEQTGLLERWVQVANALAEDRSPREPLSFLAPKRPFMVKTEAAGSPRRRAGPEGRSMRSAREQVFLDPRSYERYDVFGDVVSSVDAKAFANVVHELHPLLQGAYRALGYATGDVDQLASRALQRIVQAPVVDGQIELKPAGALYKYADQKLESLGAVEKHLLRMGPANEKKIQQKAAEIADALGLPKVATKQP